MYRLKYPVSEAVGLGAHRAGWPGVVEVLARHSVPDGMLLDDFLDRTFTYPCTDNEVHTEPWVGIMHHPQRMPGWMRGASPQEYMRSPRFQRSQPYLRGVITLCDYLSEWVRDTLKVPTLTLRYPMPDIAAKWAAPAERPPDMWQFGWYLRNTMLIDQIKTDLVRYRTGSTNPAGQHYAGLVQAYWASRGTRPNVPGVIEIPRLEDAAYDSILSRAVLVAEYFDVAASTLVVESMTVGTPLICNYHPAIAEYLGADYPLYACSPREFGLLAEDAVALNQAHVHLCHRRNTLVTADEFVTGVRDFIKTLGHQ